MTLIDWWQVAGFLVAFGMLMLIILGGYAYYSSEKRKVHTAESDKLADTRGKRIEDLEHQIERNEVKHAESIAEMDAKIQHQQGQIDMLRAMKTQEIIDGVVTRGIPAVIEGVVTGLRKEGIG